MRKFEVINLDDATATYIGLTLTDSVVDANATSQAMSVIGIDTTGGTATTALLNIDASAVTNTAVLTLTGGSAVDTIKGGAGADEINGGGGADTLTGGAGKDDFASNATNGLDTITDFDWGTASTTVDQLDLSATLTTTSLADVDLITGTVDGNTDVLILSSAAYATAELAENAVVATNATGEGVVIWQNSLGQVIVAHDADMNADATGFDEELFIIEGVSISDIASLIDTGDFIA
mgnify:CR=1 FL=1